MILKDYLSVSGLHGLYKFVAQGRNAMIIEHPETGKRTTAFATSKVSKLEDISIYTGEGETPLSEVFDKIYEKENGGPAPDDKSDISLLQEYFTEILPEYDRQRVYASDIRKIFLWYNMLHKLNLLVKEEPEKEEKEKEKEKAAAENTKDSVTDVKPPAKTAKKSPEKHTVKISKAKATPSVRKTGRKKGE